MGATLGTIGEEAAPSLGERAVRLLVAVVLAVVASFATTIAITNKDRGEFNSIAIVALAVAATNVVLRPVLDWAAPAYRAVTTTIFLVLVNTAAFGIADQLATRNNDLAFGVQGFWEAMAGGVMLVAVTIVLRRVLALATGRRH